jgi:hypothetical protein
MTETPDRPLDDETDDFEDRTLSEATPWGSDDVARDLADLGEDGIGGRDDDAPESNVKTATSVGDEHGPKDTDAIPNV